MVFCTIVIVKLISMVGLLFCNKVPHRSLLFKKKAVLMYIYIVLSYYHTLMVSKVSSNPFNFTLSVLSLKRKRCEYFFSKCLTGTSLEWSKARYVCFLSEPKANLFPRGSQGLWFWFHTVTTKETQPPHQLTWETWEESTSPNSYSFGVWPKLYGLSCDLLKVSCVVYH